MKISFIVLNFFLMIDKKKGWTQNCKKIVGGKEEERR